MYITEQGHECPAMWCHLGKMYSVGTDFKIFFKKTKNNVGELDFYSKLWTMFFWLQWLVLIFSLSNHSFQARSQIDGTQKFRPDLFFYNFSKSKDKKIDKKKTACDFDVSTI